MDSSSSRLRAPFRSWSWPCLGGARALPALDSPPHSCLSPGRPGRRPNCLSEGISSPASFSIRRNAEGATSYRPTGDRGAGLSRSIPAFRVTRGQAPAQGPRSSARAPRAALGGLRPTASDAEASPRLMRHRVSRIGHLLFLFWFPRLSWGVTHPKIPPFKVCSSVGFVQPQSCAAATSVHLGHFPHPEEKPCALRPSAPPRRQPPETTLLLPVSVSPLQGHSVCAVTVTQGGQESPLPAASGPGAVGPRSTSSLRNSSIFNLG